MRNNDHKHVGSKGNPYDHYTEEEKKKLEAMLKKMVTSDNTPNNLTKCPLCKGRGTMPKVDESKDINMHGEQNDR
jgi:hypothetical protein